VTTLLVTTVIAVLLMGLFQRVLGHRMSADAEVGCASVARLANDYATVARANIWIHASTSGGAILPSAPSYTPTIGAPWLADPAEPFSWGVPSDATFAANPSYSVEAFTNPKSVLRYAPYTRLIRYQPRLGIQTTIGEATVRRVVDVDIPLYETPTLAFEFVTTDQPFDLSASSTIIVNGVALMAKGATGTNSAGSSFTGGVLVPGNSGSVLARIPTSTGERISWGVDTSDLLSAGTTTTAGRAQSYAQAPAVVTIDYPAAGSVAPGGSFSTLDFEGQSYLAVDLGTYTGPTHVFINASASGAAVGVIVFGAPAGGSLPPVVLSGTCRFTLVGSNKRPMAVVSNHPVLTVYSDAIDGLPDAASAAIDTSWHGYIHLPVLNPTLRTPQGWTGATFTLLGSLAFKGGSLHLDPGAPSAPLTAILIERSSALKSAMLPDSIHKDRIVVTSQP